MKNTEIKNSSDNELGEVKSFSAPRLDAKDRLYLRVYLSTLSHSQAHLAVTPGLKHPKEDNPFSRKESIAFHISSALQDRADSMGLGPDVILEKLYKEATREGAGSNHAARIQALTQLGKHFGLFQDKKESAGHTFNIINYGSLEYEPPSLDSVPAKLIESKNELLDLPDGVVLTDYKD